MHKAGKGIRIKAIMVALLGAVLFLGAFENISVQAAEKNDGNVGDGGIVIGVIQPRSFAEDGVITGNGVRLRANPNTGAAILELMYWGESVEIDMSNSTMTFYYVKRNKTGTVGYVSKDYVAIPQPTRWRNKGS